MQSITTNKIESTLFKKDWQFHEYEVLHFDDTNNTGIQKYL